MKYESVIYEKQSEIAWIKFNRPQVLNAVNYQMAHDFLLALEEARRDPEVRVVILKGEGRAFSAGADVKEVSIPKSDQDMRDRHKNYQDAAHQVRILGKPIIAAVHGYALGAGCEYAMICDIRIAAEGTKFGFPEASVGGPITLAGTQMLVKLVGLAKAKEMVFTSDFIDAREAEKIGLVNQVVPPDRQDRVAFDMAKKIARNYPVAVRWLRSNLDLSSEMSQDAILHFESAVGEICRLAGTMTEGFTAKKQAIAEKEK